MVVAFTTTTFAAGTPPKLTVGVPLNPVKLVPLIVTGVPPALGPELGVTTVTVGTAT